MLIQLGKLFDEPGRTLDIDVSVPAGELNELRPYDNFAAPLAVKGSIVNRAGLVTLSVTVSIVLEQTCDRCLKAFEREFVRSFTHTLVTSLANGDDEDDGGDFVVCPDNTLEIGELALTDLMLEMPSKILCKEDCLGLCPKCGRDLNEGSCGCE